VRLRQAATAAGAAGGSAGRRRGGGPARLRGADEAAHGCFCRRHAPRPCSCDLCMPPCLEPALVQAGQWLLGDTASVASGHGPQNSIACAVPCPFTCGLETQLRPPHALARCNAQNKSPVCARHLRLQRLAAGYPPAAAPPPLRALSAGGHASHSQPTGSLLFTECNSVCNQHPPAPFRSLWRPAARGHSVARSSGGCA
jgi:hypothetical protein